MGQFGGKLRRFLKYSFAAAFYHSGAMRLSFRLLRRLDRENRLIVLAYHKVLPRGKEAGAVQPEHFASQLRALGRLFTFVTPEEAMEALGQDGPRPRRYPVLLSFDIGYEHVLRYAVPVLRRQNIPGLLFLSTGLIGSRDLLWPDEVSALIERTPQERLSLRFRGWEEVYPLPHLPARRKVAALLKQRLKRLPYEEFASFLKEIRARVGLAPLIAGEEERLLDWEGVRQAEEAGLQPASHGARHLMLSRLPDETLTEELATSQAQLAARLGSRSLYLAYPNGERGDYDERSRLVARSAGFLYAFTMEPRIASAKDDPLALPRVSPEDEPGFALGLLLLRLLVREVLRKERAAPTSRLQPEGEPASARAAPTSPFP